MTADPFARLPPGTPASDYPGASACPLEYPGRRPDTSYLFARGHVWPVQLSPGNSLEVAGVTLDDLLTALGLPPLAERYLVLAVGSNACPGRLAEKFAREFPDAALPVLRGHIDGVDSVYCADLAGYAAVPASCVGSPGTRLEGWGLLLAQSELEWLNRTEDVGVWYDLVELPEPFHYHENRLGPVYAYTHRHTLHLDGSPVRLACFAAARPRFPALDQPGVLARVLDALNVFPERPLAERQARLRTDADFHKIITDRILREFGRPTGSAAPGPPVTMERVRPARRG